jgi:uncharacterized protein
VTRVRLVLAFLFALLAVPAQAQTFPALTGRVVDAANLLSPEQEAQLTQLSADIEKASSRQFVVATIPDLQGYSIEDYGYQLGRKWGIGQKDASNGIILIVAPNERKVRIEVGYGLEPVMTDALSSVIVRHDILPRFKAGDMPGGIMAGANAIGEQMKLPLEAAEVAAKQKVDAAAPQRTSSGKSDGTAGVLVLVFWGIVILFFVFGSIAGRNRRGRRYRSGSGLGEVLLWTAIDAAMHSNDRGHGSGGWGSGGGSDWGGGGGGGGFSGGGGSFGGGGASGSW